MYLRPRVTGAHTKKEKNKKRTCTNLHTHNQHNSRQVVIFNGKSVDILAPGLRVAGLRSLHLGLEILAACRSHVVFLEPHEKNQRVTSWASALEWFCFFSIALP